MTGSEWWRQDSGWGPSGPQAVGGEMTLGFGLRIMVHNLCPAPDSAVVWGYHFFPFGPQFPLPYNEGLNCVVSESLCCWLVQKQEGNSSEPVH